MFGELFVWKRISQKLFYGQENEQKEHEKACREEGGSENGGDREERSRCSRDWYFFIVL